MKSLPDDPRFKYVDYAHTNLQVTFARVRRELAAKAKAEAEAEAAKHSNVKPIKPRKDTNG